MIGTFFEKNVRVNNILNILEINAKTQRRKEKNRETLRLIVPYGYCSFEPQRALGVLR
jgi:hypothetical protein